MSWHAQVETKREFIIRPHISAVYFRQIAQSVELAALELVDQGAQPDILAHQPAKCKRAHLNGKRNCIYLNFWLN